MVAPKMDISKFQAQKTKGILAMVFISLFCVGVFGLFKSNPLGASFPFTGNVTWIVLALAILTPFVLKLIRLKYFESEQNRFRAKAVAGFLIFSVLSVEGWCQLLNEVFDSAEPTSKVCTFHSLHKGRNSWILGQRIYFTDCSSVQTSTDLFGERSLAPGEKLLMMVQPGALGKEWAGLPPSLAQ